MGEWKRANYADRASDAAKDACCGDANCFDGCGCDTARWWTKRLETRGYRLIKTIRLVTDPPAVTDA